MIEKSLIEENDICLDDCDLARINYLIQKEKLQLFEEVNIHFEDDKEIREIFNELKGIYNRDEVKAFDKMFSTLFFYKMIIDKKESFDKNEYINSLKKDIAKYRKLVK